MRTGTPQERELRQPVPTTQVVTDAGRAALERMAAPWKITPQDWSNGSDRLLGTFARLINSPASCVGAGAVRELWNSRRSSCAR
jgi:hypothetical protein